MSFKVKHNYNAKIRFFRISLTRLKKYSIILNAKANSNALTHGFHTKNDYGI